jgi:hypothetical protein
MLEKLNELMGRLNSLEDLYETSIAEDDRWTAQQCLIELSEINKKLDELEGKEP